MGNAGHQLLQVAGDAWDLLIFRFYLMKRRRRSVGDYVQGDVEDPGDEALAIQTRTETLADDLVEVGLIADTKLLVCFDLSEFLVNRNHDWHGKISGGLIMPNQYVHDRADGYAAKFHRGAGI